MKKRKSGGFFDPLRDMRSEWIDEAIDSSKIDEKRTNRINIKKILSIAACAVILIVGTTCVIHAEEITTAIRSLFTREQELIDPYAIVNTEQDDDVDPSAVSLKVNKIFRDGDIYYIDIKIHKPTGFNCEFLFYEEIGIYCDDNGRSDRITVFGGGSDPNMVALAATNIQGKFVSDTDFEAVIKLGAWQSVLPQGEYTFEIYGLSEARLLDEPDEANLKWYYSEVCADMLSNRFTVGEEGFQPLPVKTTELGTEFEIEGYKFVLDEITVSPMSLELTITDELHQVKEVDGMHFNAIGMFINYCFSKEFDFPYSSLEETLEDDYEYKYHSSEEVNAFNKFKTAHGLNYDYSIAFELSDEAKKYWKGGRCTRELIVGDDGDRNAITIKAMFEAPIYEDEILAIGFARTDIGSYNNENFGHIIETEIWRKQAQ